MSVIVRVSARLENSHRTTRARTALVGPNIEQAISRFRAFVERTCPDFALCSIPESEHRMPTCAIGGVLAGQPVGLAPAAAAGLPSRSRPDQLPNPGEGMNLRPFAATDVQSAIELIARAMNPEEGEYAGRTFREYLLSRQHGIDDGRELYLLCDERRVIGITGLHHYLWGPPGNVWLSWFAVDPSSHGKGLGKWLMVSTVELAGRRGYRQLFIETYSSPTFERARAFYAANGFEEVGGVRGYMPDGAGMVVLRRQLA